ncbi:MAG: toll/interleukin-1 receptor domain-containing protein [Polyangiaceae bacterium]|nr:toll/interleukin-1 receptor domain-containing protein [Polyangiaceae bacterium]
MTHDVFLSHNSRDKPAVRELKRELEARGISVWLDKKELRPGDRWLSALDAAIKDSKTVAVLVGASGVGPWQDEEMDAALQLAVRKGHRVIPVLLAGAPESPELPLFLKGRTWVDLRAGLTGAGLDQLVFGVTGNHPRSDPTAVPPPARSSTPHAGPPCRVSPPRLPRVTASKLVGRDQELARLHSLLDAALAEHTPRTHVATMVAWGGIGKTALVAHFMDELAARGWAGLERVLEWSFYSQGTGEQSGASADTFVKDALTFFGDENLAESSASAWDKGTRLATLVAGGRHLLVLDGLEPLQHPPGLLAGTLKNGALQALLVGLARQAGSSLCIVTTREPVADLRRFHSTTVAECHLEALSAVAGAKLLRQLGVKGSAAELEALSRDVQGHALTLELFGSYLERAHGGDVRQRDHVHLETADTEVTGGHATRVMAAYEAWLASGGERGTRQLALLRLMGLFDRPADPACLLALRQPPAIPGLTGPLAGLADAEWNGTVHDLEQAGLVRTSVYQPSVVFGFSKEQSERPSEERGEPTRFHDRNAVRLLGAAVLDVHPLVREHFGRKLREERPEAFRMAHARLFEHLTASVPYWPEGLEGLQPLFQAVAHGCQAGLHRRALDKVYKGRIRRGDEEYSVHMLGAFEAELGALGWFFETPWMAVVPRLAQENQAWVLDGAAFALRAVGRLTEALEPRQVGLKLFARLKDWKSAAISACNLSELELTLGDVAVAIEDAARSVEYADRSQDRRQFVSRRAALADALHQAGRREEALERFREAEAMQGVETPHYPLLYGLRGFWYCDLLLSAAERVAWRGTVDRESAASSRIVRKRAIRLAEWRTVHDSLLTVALDWLTLGRTELYQSVLEPTSRDARAAAAEHLNQAVDGFRTTRQQDDLPRALLSRAWLRSLTNDPAGARADLDEARDIAERGSMRLHLADVHLYRARLLHDRAALAEARRLIDQCGYERRREELDDAEREAAGWDAA